MRFPKMCYLFAVLLPWMAGCNSSSSTDGDAGAGMEADEDAAAALVVDADATSSPEGVASLTIGDPAPTLAIGQWVKGEAIDGFQSGQVYVVEFWATWCGPCRTSMPHLSQLQTDYGDQVTMIGISDEEPAIVERFLASEQSDSGPTWHEVVTYRIALDSDHAMSNAYMRAANQNGIPTAFIVGRDGHVEWIGHPMQMDEPLARVVADQWDRVAAREEFRTRERLNELVAGLQRVVAEAQQTNDWGPVNEYVAEAEKLGLPEATIEQLKVNIAMMSSNFEEANRAAERLAEHIWDQPHQLNSVAWNLVTRIPKASQDRDLALRLAERANQLTQNSDAATLDTIARIHYESGDLEQAIEWQRRAVEHMQEGQDVLANTLKSYEDELAAQVTP